MAKLFSARVSHDSTENESRCRSLLGESVTQAVITTPAYFTDAQRQATKDAGKIAGLEVLRIINEPTAASLAYGVEREGTQTILVFDLGGGTFDVSILEIGDGVFEVKATSGNNRLGGDDFDDRIIQYLVDEFKKSNGVDLSKDKMARQRLKEAEKAKHELSTLTVTDINIPFVTATSGATHLDQCERRAKFDELTADLVERTMGPARQALNDFLVTSRSLIGYFGRWFDTYASVQNYQESFRQEPHKGINPDEVVTAWLFKVRYWPVKLKMCTAGRNPLTLGIEKPRWCIYTDDRA